MTKLLFIQGGSRWKFDDRGNLYTETNFNNTIWKRYRKYCDHLTVILRRETRVYSYSDAQQRFNEFDKSIGDYICVSDLYRPIYNALNLVLKKKVRETIEREVKESDKIIIRSLGNFYTNTALKYARKYHKPFLVEVTGFTFEGMWYHSFRGKLVAAYKELTYKNLIKSAPYVVYVTESALQKRYPTQGKTLGCSDVDIGEIDNSVLYNRKKHINASRKKLVVGTAGFLDVRYKGQSTVIKAINNLKKMGINSIEYHLIGAGNGNKLKELAHTYSIDDRVIIDGELPHEKVADWFDYIDVYIHPSYIEGLCRSIVEAMSRACPVICTSVGGNTELVGKDYLFRKDDEKELTSLMIKMMNNDILLKSAEENFNRAQNYSRDVLNKKRDSFYEEFINDKSLLPK